MHDSLLHYRVAVLGTVFDHVHESLVGGGPQIALVSIVSGEGPSLYMYRYIIIVYVMCVPVGSCYYLSDDGLKGGGEVVCLYYISGTGGQGVLVGCLC